MAWKPVDMERNYVTVALCMNTTSSIDVKNVQIQVKNVKNVKKRDKNRWKNVCKRNKKRYLFLV